MLIYFYINGLVGEAGDSSKLLCAEDEFGRRYSELFIEGSNRSLKKARKKIIKRAKILSGENLLISNKILRG